MKAKVFYVLLNKQANISHSNLKS